MVGIKDNVKYYLGRQNIPLGCLETNYLFYPESDKILIMQLESKYLFKESWVNIFILGR